MPQSFSSVFLHLVFSTKGRHPFLADRDIRAKLYSYLGGIAVNRGCSPLLVGGVADHVHLLVNLGREETISGLVKELKRSSTLWIKNQFPILGMFAWQGGYAALGVDVAGLEGVRRYIANQDRHHGTISFQDELRALLSEHQMNWDERYVWD